MLVDRAALLATPGHPAARRRGYTLLDIDRERVQGEFWHVDTIEQRTGNQMLGRALVDVAGQNGLKVASSASAALTAADPAPDAADG